MTWTFSLSQLWQTHCVSSTLCCSGHMQRNSEQFHFHGGGKQDPYPHHVCQKSNLNKQHSLHCTLYAIQVFPYPTDSPKRALPPSQTAININEVPLYQCSKNPHLGGVFIRTNQPEESNQTDVDGLVGFFHQWIHSCFKKWTTKIFGTVPGFTLQPEPRTELK